MMTAVSLPFTAALCASSIRSFLPAAAGQRSAAVIWNLFAIFCHGIDCLLRIFDSESHFLGNRHSANNIYSLRTYRMAHRKWKKTKQQTSLLPGPAVSGCCLVSFFLWAILNVRRLYLKVTTMCPCMAASVALEFWPCPSARYGRVTPD